MEEQQPQRRLRVREVVEVLRARGFELTERAVRAEIRGLRLRATKIRNIHWVSVGDLETYIRERENMPSSNKGDLATVA